MWALPRTTSLMIDWVTCMHIFVNKENSFVLRLLLKDWNYFWNKYCNLPFPVSLFDICCVILISKSENCAANELVAKLNILWTKRSIEEKIIIILKGSIKQLVIKQSPTFPSFSILIDCFMSVFFFFSYKSVSKISKVNKISSSSFYYM